jgi:hypothetical protein
MVWQSEVPRDQQSPYQNEWNDLVDAIRGNKPYNEVKYGVEASLVTSMGRMAAHTGQESYEQMLIAHEMAPDVDKLMMDSPAPLLRRQRPTPCPAWHRQESRSRVIEIADLKSAMYQMPSQRALQ